MPNRGIIPVEHVRGNFSRHVLAAEVSHAPAGARQKISAFVAEIDFRRADEIVVPGQARKLHVPIAFDNNGRIRQARAVIESGYIANDKPSRIFGFCERPPESEVTVASHHLLPNIPA